MRVRILLSVTVILAVISSTCLLFGASHSVINDIVQDPYFQKLIYRSYRPGAINERGAAHQNVRSEGRFDIWYQQICWDAVVAGIGGRREKDIQLGLKAVKYGFERMDEDGSFEGSSATGAVRFLLAFAKSYYEIEKSAYKERYIEELNLHIPKLRKAAYHVLNSPEWKAEQTRISFFSNQIIGMGLTFKLSGAVLGDQEIIGLGNKLFYQGINGQTAEGVFPEKGGYDSSYQAVSLQFIELYYLYSADDKEREGLFSVLKKGWEWQLSRIENSGKIKTAGNTRTGLKQEAWRGKFKDVNYPEVALSLIYWSHIASDQDLRELAKKIFEYGIRYRK